MSSGNPFPDRQADLQGAYALLRLYLGVNMAMHGIGRILAGPAVFQGKLESQFAHALLPHAAVAAFGLVLPWIEAFLGLLLLAGLATRLALIGGLLWLTLLTFGSALIQDWSAAGVQLLYALAYAALLAFRHLNRFSLDALRQPRTPNP